MSNYIEHRKQAASKFAEWLADGETWIGVFEGVPGSGRGGKRVALAFDMEPSDDGAHAGYEGAEIGMRAPDTRNLIGWPYKLVEKCLTVEAAMRATFGPEEE